MAGHGLALVLESGGHSALRCTGFSFCGLSCCGVQALGTSASVAVTHRLSSGGLKVREHGLSSCDARALDAPRHLESSQTRDQTHAPCIGRQILIHCTIKEVHLVAFIITFNKTKDHLFFK